MEEVMNGILIREVETKNIAWHVFVEVVVIEFAVLRGIFSCILERIFNE